jgi:hypothetical protein
MIHHREAGALTIACGGRRHLAWGRERERERERGGVDVQTRRRHLHRQDCAPSSSRPSFFFFFTTPLPPSVRARMCRRVRWLSHLWLPVSTGGPPPRLACATQLSEENYIGERGDGGSSAVSHLCWMSRGVMNGSERQTRSRFALLLGTRSQAGRAGGRVTCLTTRRSTEPISEKKSRRL